MNRKETTKFLGDLLVSDKLSGLGKYWAKEVSIDYGTKDVRRVDFMQFEPAGVTSVSSIEKGIFTCYEIKSCKEDVFSGKGLNFIGEKNYIVTTMQCWKDIQEDYRNGRLAKHIKDCSPNSSLYYGIMVAIPKYAEEIDEFEKPTPLDPGKDWKLKIILPCEQGFRKKSLTEMGGSEKIPIIQAMKIIKNDIYEMSDYKYDLEDIDYLLRAKYKTPMEQKNYIYALEEDITSYITQKHGYNKVHNPIFRDMKNSLQYDMSHLYPLICGQKFIVKTPDHFSKQDYTDYILEEIFDIPCAVICFEGKNMYTNLIAMFQKSENIISFSYDNEDYEGNAYRLSLASVQNRDEQYIVPIAEYILEKECFLKNGTVFSESGTTFCQGKCDIANHMKVVINDKYRRNYCLNRRDDNKMLCTCRSLNPANIIGGIGYALYHLHNREDVSKMEHIRNAEEKHGTVSLCDSDMVSEKFPSYHVIKVSPNYSYSNNDVEDIGDDFHTHKSPIEHYRKGTPVIINKNGTVYSRKATIVNKGNTDDQTVYKV